MNPTRAVIIDDEEGARESLNNILRDYFTNIEVVAKADSADSGYAAITKYQPDLVFLDIEMPLGNAFDLLEKFNKISFDIIFITAYDHYAINAIKFSALDYLLKPIDIDDLRAAIERFEAKKKENKGTFSDQRFEALLENLKTRKSRKVAIPDTDGLLFVHLDEIIRCESDGNYTSIIMANDRRILASRTLGEYEELFRGENFFRTHRSHLINLEHIQKYIKGEGGYVIMSDSSQVEVSRRKKTEFIEALAKV